MPNVQPDDPHALLTALLRRDFTAFLRKAYPWISAGEPMLWNWHLDAIANQLNQVMTGDKLRLLVTLPPRNGKSKTISVIWVAFMLGQDPRLNFVCVSYSNELSAKMARDCLSIMRSTWYRELFPRTIISEKRSATADFETTAGGGRLATSVTGTLTGRGGDIIILDDVIKPDEANSDTMREFVNGWFESTLASRLNDKASGAIIGVMQRLHQDDLAGKLLERGGWHHLTIPAIAIHDERVPLTRGRVHFRRAGDVLHPEREPREVLDELKRSMGSLAFAAQYQQDPVPAVGNMIKREWLRTYGSDFDISSPGLTVQSWDTASKDGIHNDFSVCITVHVLGATVRIIDVFRKKMEFPELRRAAVELARRFRPSTILVEDKASGTQLIQSIGDTEPGVSRPLARQPELDKISRVAGVSAMIENGQLLLPENAPWLAEFTSELLAFPNARFDDQVDALSQLLIWVRQRNARINTVIGAPILYFEDEDGVRWEEGPDGLKQFGVGDDGWPI